MSTPRHTVVPLSHIEAEMAAFPLASEAALRIGTTYLAPTLDTSTQQLWRAAESEFVGASPALSLDEIGAMRDLVWFRHDHGSRRIIQLADFLRVTAKTYLRVEGSIAVPRLEYGSASEQTEVSDATTGRDMWRWMSFALPPDLLLAALADPFPPGEVAAISPVLSALLRQHRFAEMHVHLGAAMTFTVLWSSAVHAIADPGMKATALNSPGAALEEGRDLAPWLLRAAIARCILGAFLSSVGNETFDDFVARVRRRTVERRGRTTATAVLDYALADLCIGRISKPGPSFAELQTLYADISRVRTRRPASGDQPVHGLDPLYAFTQGDPAWLSPEVWLVSRGLVYMTKMAKMRENGSGDEHIASLFERLFWQTVRVRCLLYRHVVQRPLAPGLQWFIRFFARIKPLRGKLLSSDNLPSRRLAAAADVCGVNEGLSALELRISPDKTVQELLKELEDGDIRDPVGSRERPAEAPRRSRIANRVLNAPAGSRGIANRDWITSSQKNDRLEVGYILHFARNRGGGFNEGLQKARWQATEADPGYAKNATGYRFGRHYLELYHRALVVGRLLTAFPVTLELVRGIDVCTDEVGIPTWVMAPLVRYVREASMAASAALLRGPNYIVPAIRTAVHAGEDFVHLLSGMRRLGESIEYFHLGPGDRIGHGLSLGVDPEPWARKMGRLVMSREDRLLDLIWAWKWIGRGIISSEEAPSIEAEIRRLSALMFPPEAFPPRDRRPPLEAAELVQLFDDLHNEEFLRAAGFPSRIGSGASLPLERQRLVRLYLTSRGVFARSKEPIWVDPSREGKLLGQLQEMLRKRIAANDIAVEVNPSSNLLIGHVPDLREHPLWRLRPGPHRPAVTSPVTLCIGSDDPLTFATTLPQEYQLLHDALVTDGASADQAEQWLDEIRRAGLTRKFTVRRSGLDLTEPIPVMARLTPPP